MMTYNIQIALYALSLFRQICYQHFIIIIIVITTTTTAIAIDSLSQHPSPSHGLWEAKRVST